MPSDVQLALADYFRHQAYFRQEKARQYPDDERNQRAADGLLELAGYVVGLPADDDRITVFAEPLERLDGMLDFAPGSYGSLLSTRFRFNDPFQSFDDFLVEFAEVVPAGVDDWLEMIDDSIY
ncbi:hypothetical protein BH23CHL2_BH23CHL2_08920 [soil metagenome]